MKKITLIILALAMTLTLAVAASASVGTVVNATKTEKAPNMEEIDSTWGQPAIVVNASSANTELYEYFSQKSLDMHLLTQGEYDTGKAKNLKVENHDVELYYLWDAKYIYFGMKTKDDVLAGSPKSWNGDGVQMWLQPMENAVSTGSTTSGVNSHHEINPLTAVYDFSCTLDMDDYSTNNRSMDGYMNAAESCDCYINSDIDGELQVMMKIPLINLGLNPKNDLTGEELATAVLRVSLTEMVANQGYNGWLSWGKYFNDCSAASLNTVVLTGSSAPADTEDTAPADTEDSTVEITPNLDGVSSWALAEVEAGIKEGLVPANLQANYTSPVTRGAVAQMFVNLLEKAAGKSIDDIM
ncbi:MAG: hypothetical protein IJU57_07275, partial [Clostridia bacterium]|nr:hypothetical protein [Clostridia bacterium]